MSFVILPRRHFLPWAPYAVLFVLALIWLLRLFFGVVWPPVSEFEVALAEKAAHMGSVLLGELDWQNPAPYAAAPFMLLETLLFVLFGPHVWVIRLPAWILSALLAYQSYRFMKQRHEPEAALLVAIGVMGSLGGWVLGLLGIEFVLTAYLFGLAVLIGFEALETRDRAKGGFFFACLGLAVIGGGLYLLFITLLALFFWGYTQGRLSQLRQAFPWFWGLSLLLLSWGAWQGVQFLVWPGFGEYWLQMGGFDRNIFGGVDPNLYNEQTAPSVLIWLYALVAGSPFILIAPLIPLTPNLRATLSTQGGLLPYLGSFVLAILAFFTVMPSLFWINTLLMTLPMGMLLSLLWYQLLARYPKIQLGVWVALALVMSLIVSALLVRQWREDERIRHAHEHHTHERLALVQTT